MMQNKKVAIVTGGSSGIGLGTAQMLYDEGCVVYSLSRRDFSNSNIHHIQVDITDNTALDLAVQSIFECEGRIDVLVNCAGFGISGAAEFTDTKDAERQIGVNFIGTHNATKAVLKYMRNQGFGRVVNISSVAAVVPIPFQAFYSASKSAINSYTFALANEVRPYGVTVTAVQPGDVATGFTDARSKSFVGDDCYDGRIQRSVARMEKDERSGLKAEKVGEYVAKIALKRRVKPLYTSGFSYKCVCLLVKLLPCGFLNKIIGRLYAR